jgi:hypothetical protein
MLYSICSFMRGSWRANGVNSRTYPLNQSIVAGKACLQLTHVMPLGFVAKLISATQQSSNFSLQHFKSLRWTAQ